VKLGQKNAFQGCKTAPGTLCGGQIAARFADAAQINVNKPLE
jgi:hypothetical protein